MVQANLRRTDEQKWMDPLTLHLGTLTASCPMDRSCPVTELSGLSCYQQLPEGLSPRKGQRPDSHTRAWVSTGQILEVPMPILRRLSKWQWRDERSGRRFSPTNGKKSFPRGYKATTQNRCAEKPMRKWFCENNSLDPVHPKQTTLPVLTDMKERGSFQTITKSKYTPSWWHALLPQQMLWRMCSCVVSASTPFYTLSLSSLTTGLFLSLLWGAPPTVQGALCSCQTPVKSNPTVGLPCCSTIVSGT